MGESAPCAGDVSAGLGLGRSKGVSRHLVLIRGRVDAARLIGNDEPESLRARRLIITT